MKALKSELAKKLLSDKTSAESLRKAVEAVVSSHSAQAKQPPEAVSYVDKKGVTTRLRASVVLRSL